MKALSAITSNPNQTFKVNLDTGENVTIGMTYKESQYGWFISVTYSGLTIRNRRVVNSPNMLRAFRSIIPFGISCAVSNNLEPIRLTDFESGFATLYLLNENDLALVEETVIPGYLNAKV